MTVEPSAATECKWVCVIGNMRLQDTSVGVRLSLPSLTPNKLPVLKYVHVSNFSIGSYLQ